MGHEATTMAVSEPALSFEFDSSQSLFEQLTKAQQANTSSFSANASSAYSQSTSPVMRAVDSMPPPQLVPQPMPTVTEEIPPSMVSYAMTMPPTMASNFIKREQEFGQVQYDRNGTPLTRMHQRHTSMPTYMEYSPAPSFVSSHFEDYSNRSNSFDPETPPQHAQAMGAEPAYIANEDTGLYTAIPEINSSHSYHPMMQLPPSNFSGTQYSTSRGYPSSNVYSVIEGSPTYKQRRRRSSIPPGAVAAATVAATNGQPHAPHRQSDLRRSVSASVGPVAESEEGEGDSPSAIPSGYANMIQQQKELLELSRHGTPLPTLEGSPQHQMAILPPQDDYFSTDSLQQSTLSTIPATRSDRPGPIRRARSATMMELGAPYPHKSHSCPIPTCGRLFKRLEHLKRYAMPLYTPVLIFFILTSADFSPRRLDM